MTTYIFKSNWTWRTLSQQGHVLKDVKCDKAHTLVGARGLAKIIRHSEITAPDVIYAASADVFATSAEAMRELLVLCKARGIGLRAVHNNFAFLPRNKIEDGLSAWLMAKANGAVRIGAAVSAERKRARSAAGVAKIARRWPMSSDEWPTRVLLAEAGVSLNTAKSYLGRRPLAQAAYAKKATSK